MFKRIQIKNFFSCQDVVLDNLSSVTALVGHNASGKSNILKAIQWAAQSVSSVQPIESMFRYPPTSIYFDMILDKGYFRYQLDILLIGSSANDTLQNVVNEQLEQKTSKGWETLLSRKADKIKLSNKGTEIQTGVTTPSLPALIALIPKNPIIKAITKIVNFLKSVHYYPLDEPNQLDGLDNMSVVKASDYKEWLNQYHNRPDANTSVMMRLLHLSRSKKEDFEEIKILLGDNGLKLITDIVVYNHNDLYFEILFYPYNNLKSSTSTSFNYNKLSLGTRRLLRILVSLIHDQSTVLLLEHPEDSIHSGLLPKLISLFKSYSEASPFILTSHAPEIFNSLEPGAIRLVTMEQGITSVRALDETEMAAACQFIREEGTLADFLETIQEH